MFGTLFGAEVPLAVQFFVAFLMVLAVIGAAAWAIRRFGSGRLGASTRGRQVFASSAGEALLPPS